MYFFLNQELPKSETSTLHLLLFSITRRNFNIWVQLLCQVLPPPPPGTGKTSVSWGKFIWESPSQGQEACERGLGELNLEKWQLWGTLEQPRVHMGRVLRWWSQAFGVVWWERSRDKRRRLKQGRCRVTIRKKILLIHSRAGYQGFWVINYYTMIRTEWFVLLLFYFRTLIQWEICFSGSS